MTTKVARFLIFPSISLSNGSKIFVIVKWIICMYLQMDITGKSYHLYAQCLTLM